jgi:hypothetical protein
MKPGQPKRYPSKGAYVDAMEHHERTLVDLDLRAGKVARSPKTDALRAWSGQFSTVFQVESGNRTWAIRCFTGDIGDAATIYAEVGAYLRQLQSPYFVGFEYQEEGIRVGSEIYPIVKMEWTTGKPLNDFVEQHRKAPETIRSLADAWRRMLAELVKNRIAHGDLQHGNVFIRSGGAGPEIKLVDYDTVVVPKLVGFPEQNIGLPSYQHPRREDVAIKHLGVDAFSGVAIYASLAAIAQDPEVWDELDLDADVGLLFKGEDFDQPGTSSALKALRVLDDECARIADALQKSCEEWAPSSLPDKRDALAIPHLEDLLKVRWWVPTQAPDISLARRNEALVDKLAQLRQRATEKATEQERAERAEQAARSEAKKAQTEAKKAEQARSEAEKARGDAQTAEQTARREAEQARSDAKKAAESTALFKTERDGAQGKVTDLEKSASKASAALTRTRFMVLGAAIWAVIALARSCDTVPQAELATAQGNVKRCGDEKNVLGGEVTKCNEEKERYKKENKDKADECTQEKGRCEKEKQSCETERQRLQAQLPCKPGPKPWESNRP